MPLRFFHNITSLGKKHFAYQILYKMCELNDSQHPSLGIANYSLIANTLEVAVIKGKFDFKTYSKLATKTQLEVIDDLAEYLKSQSEKYPTNYNVYFEKSDRLCIMTGVSGIQYNQIEKKTNGERQITSVALPKDLFENHQELERILIDHLSTINNTMTILWLRKDLEDKARACCGHRL